MVETVSCVIHLRENVVTCFQACPNIEKNKNLPPLKFSKGIRFWKKMGKMDENPCRTPGYFFTFVRFSLWRLTQCNVPVLTNNQCVLRNLIIWRSFFIFTRARKSIKSQTWPSASVFTVDWLIRLIGLGSYCMGYPRASKTLETMRFSWHQEPKRDDRASRSPPPPFINDTSDLPFTRLQDYKIVPSNVLIVVSFLFAHPLDRVCRGIGQSGIITSHPHVGTWFNRVRIMWVDLIAPGGDNGRMVLGKRIYPLNLIGHRRGETKRY